MNDLPLVTFIQGLPLILQIICWVGVWAGLGIALAATLIVIGTVIGLPFGVFLPGVFMGKDGAKISRWILGLSAALGPVAPVGLLLAVMAFA